MRKQPDETLEQWAIRVQQYEYGHALKDVASGQDIDTVMEKMSVRIRQKLLHPIIAEIKQSTNQTFDLEATKKSYEEAYKKINPQH